MDIGVDLGEEWGMVLDHLGHFAAGIDPAALEGAEDGSEAAFLCFEAALQGLDHLPVGGRILELHISIERVVIFLLPLVTDIVVPS
jgi:hypothetical protein